MTFFRPIGACLLPVSTGLVPGPSLCPGAGDAKRLQEILYVFHVRNTAVSKNKESKKISTNYPTISCATIYGEI
jgi:hypothetical protein